MTVKEVIEELQKYPEQNAEAIISIWRANGQEEFTFNPMCNNIENRTEKSKSGKLYARIVHTDNCRAYRIVRNQNYKIVDNV